MCEDGDVLTTIKNILVMVKIVKVVLPTIVILASIVSFSKTIGSNKEDNLKDATNKLIKRLIAAIIVVFIPTFINGIITLISTEQNNYELCIENANDESIKQAYYNKAKKLIQKARDTLEISYYREALNYLDNVKDKSQKEELNTDLEEVKYYIDLLNKINAMTKKEEYTPLKNTVNSISDSTIREKLSNALEEKYQTIKVEEVAKIQTTGTIIKKEETESLKVYIHKVNSYYVTQIWARSPYNQLNKYDSPQYGSSLYKPSALLQDAINDKHLSNQLIVAFNASGFYLRDTFDAASVNSYSAYDKTSVGTLVITDGKVVRNAYNHAVKTWYIAGIDRTNTLRIYEDKATNNSVEKEQWAKTIIGSIRNTYTFASPLVMNGQASSITTSMPSPGSSLNRQALCQIDSNNFLLITGSNLSRQDLINIMLQNKCKTGTNFDGGGSIALLFKSKNSTSIETIIGNGRALTEVGYFTE